MIIPLADRLGDVKTYYFVKKLEEIRQMNAEGKDVISFGIGSPDMVPDKSVVEAMIKAAEQSSTHGYQPYKSIPELREAIATFYRKTYHVAFNADEQVLPLMGSKEGILHTTLAFVNPGDAILAPNPGYPTYTSLSKLLGAEVKYYDLKEENDWYPDFEELEKQDLSNVKLMWLNYPHMPTGTPAKKEVFEKYVAFAKKHKILICHDNPYSLVLNKNKPLSIFSIDGADEVALELNSFSKAQNMAGWRVGMMLGGKKYIDAALRVKSNIDSGMFYGIQQAAVKAMGLSETWHAERNEIYAKRRKWVFKILDKLNFQYNKEQEGLFVWAKPLNGSSGESIEEMIDRILYKKHIFFTPGSIFGSNGKEYLRLSLCVPEERIKEAFERL